MCVEEDLDGRIIDSMPFVSVDGCPEGNARSVSVRNVCREAATVLTKRCEKAKTSDSPEACDRGRKSHFQKPSKEQAIMGRLR